MDKRSLAGYSPQGHRELDMTEVTEHTHTHTHVLGRAHSVHARTCMRNPSGCTVNLFGKPEKKTPSPPLKEI